MLMLRELPLFERSIIVVSNAEIVTIFDIPGYDEFYPPARHIDKKLRQLLLFKPQKKEPESTS